MAIWVFTRWTIWPVADQWKNEWVSHQSNRPREHTTFKNKDSWSTTYGVYLLLLRTMPELDVHVNVKALISQHPHRPTFYKILVCKKNFSVYKGKSVCVCDYANHLWLLTKPQIFPRVSPLISVNLLSFLIKHQIKWLNVYLMNINILFPLMCLHNSSDN